MCNFLTIYYIYYILLHVFISNDCLLTTSRGSPSVMVTICNKCCVILSFCISTMYVVDSEAEMELMSQKNDVYVSCQVKLALYKVHFITPYGLFLQVLMI